MFGADVLGVRAPVPRLTELLRLRRGEQVAICQIGPSPFIRRHHVMAGQSVSQRDRRA